MKKQLLVLSAVTAILFVYVQAGCSGKPALEKRKDHPAATEQMEKKADEKTPAVEHPDSGKPKDHPAH